MLSDVSKTLIISLLLLFAAQGIDAQFYKQSDSIARIIKNEVRSSSTLRDNVNIKDKKAKDSKAKKSAQKKSKKAKRVRKNSVNSDTVKSPSRKKSVPYTGRKYHLGERVIMRGDSGNDVRTVANILVKKLFLDEKDIIYTADGGVLYEGEILRAVKLFQKVSNLFDDGIIGKPTLKALRRRD